jgi:hypothetical protein
MVAIVETAKIGTYTPMLSPPLAKVMTATCQVPGVNSVAGSSVGAAGHRGRLGRLHGQRRQRGTREQAGAQDHGTPGTAGGGEAACGLVGCRHADLTGVSRA